MMTTSIEHISQHIFSAEDWEKYFGHSPQVLPIPEKLTKLLASPCPFWKNSTIGDTHLLTFMPDSLDGNPYTLNFLHVIANDTSQGYQTKSYKYFSSYVKDAIGEKAIPSPYYLLMTKDIIPKSQNRNYKDQCNFIAEVQQNTKLPYALPTSLEAASSILLHYIKTGKRFYTNSDPEREWVFTRSADEVSADNWPVSIGGFSEEGVFIYRSPDFLFDKRFVGVAGVLRFD